MNTPFFLISEKELQRNIFGFKDALKKYWPNSRMAYSVKTNSLPWVLKYMKQQDVMAEVVSDEEYGLAKLCGYKDRDIVFNGPIKGEQQLVDAVTLGAIVNLDSENDIKVLCKSCVEPDNNIGFRINIPTEIFDVHDIGYMEDGFRFGFSVDSSGFQQSFQRLRERYPEKVFGLHVHCNSITRSLNVYKAIASYTSFIIKRYNLKPAFIDIGGGFFGGIEGKPTPDEYIKTITNELLDVVDIEQTKLIIEPGSALIGSVVELHTSVIDVKETSRARIVTTDGSRIHTDPLWKKTNYMYSMQMPAEAERNRLDTQIICGYTCMDHDRIMVLKNEKELQVGDKIVYHRIGAYSMTFGGMFIRYYPDVYVQYDDNRIEQVRKRIEVEEYLKIQTCG